MRKPGSGAPYRAAPSHGVYRCPGCGDPGLNRDHRRCRRCKVRLVKRGEWFETEDTEGRERLGLVHDGFRWSPSGWVAIR